MRSLRSNSSSTRILCQVLLLSACATTAFAEPVVIETVTVTAAKRAENVQDVPISMTVLSGQSLADNKDKSIHDIIGRVPNLNIVTQGVNNSVYLRGFGSSPNNFAFDPDVSLYMDGIYGGRSAQFLNPLFDVDRVEVLRGPQGGLVGKNTAAGAISITTAGPTDTFQGAATVAYNFSEKGIDAQGYVSGPITDTLSARFAAKVINQDGFLKNLATGKNDPHVAQEMGRLSLKYQPSDSLDITGKVEYSVYNRSGGIVVTGPFNARLQSIPTTRYVEDPYGPTGQPERNGVTSVNSSITANYHLGDYTFTSITGYSHFSRSPINGYDSADPSGAPATPGINNLFQNGFPENFRQVSQEVRVLSPTGQPFEYIVGAYIDQADWNVRQNIFYNIPVFGAQFTDFHQGSITYSVFGIGTYHVTDDFRVLGSLRYTNNIKSGDFYAGTYEGTPIRAITQAQGHINEDSLDPSITLQYDARKNLMFYGSVARGSKSGGFVSNTWGMTSDRFQFKPETSTNFEVGMKSTLLDGRLQFNASLYNLKIKNLQVSSYVSERSTFITNNAASATSRGAEVYATWLPLDELELTLGAAYLEAAYDDYPGAPCLASEPTTVCNSADPLSVANHNLAGTVLQYAAKWSGNIQAHHTLDLENGWKVDTNVTGSLRSKFFNADNYSTVYGIQPTVVKWDARVQLSDPQTGWAVAVAGKNLTNQKTISNILPLPASITTQPRTQAYLDPFRSVWIEASYKF